MPHSRMKRAPMSTFICNLFFERNFHTFCRKWFTIFVVPRVERVGSRVTESPNIRYSKQFDIRSSNIESSNSTKYSVTEYIRSIEYFKDSIEFDIRSDSIFDDSIFDPIEYLDIQSNRIYSNIRMNRISNLRISNTESARTEYRTQSNL